MKTKLLALVISSLAAVTIYYVGWPPLSNVLLPAFYLSAYLTVRDHAAFGRTYLITGLAINTIIFSFASVLLFRAIEWVRVRRTGGSR